MFNFGQIDEFTDPVSNGDPVILVAAKAVELGAFNGVFYQSMGAPSMAIDQKRFDIYSRTKSARDGVIGDGAGNGWAATGTTALPMTAAAIRGLTVGHVLQVENETVIVKSVDRAANTIDVHARGAGGTTAAAHADVKAFSVIGSAGNDLDLKNVEGVTESTHLYSNFVQTVFEALDWTKHAEMTRKGMSPERATLIMVREAEIRVAQMLSRMSIHGRKQAAGGAANRYMSAGLFAQLTDTATTDGGTRPVLTYAANGGLTEAKVMESLALAFAHGNPSTIWVSPKNKKVINTFNMANTSLTVGTNRTDHTAGTYVSYIDYEGKLMEVKVDVDMPDDRVPILNMSKVKKGWLADDTLRMVDEPSASSREFRKSIQGSLGFIVEDVGYEHVLMTGVTI